MPRARALRLLLGAGLVLALTAPAARAAVPPGPPLLVFPGMDASQLPGVNPPDTAVASGPGWIVEAVNTAIAMWSTNGVSAQKQKQEAYDVFFGRPGHDMTDPRVVYDKQSGRWFSTILDLSDPPVVLLGVSETGDPTGAWRVTEIDTRACADQPRLGMSDTIVAVADDAFTTCDEDGQFQGGEITLFDKQDLVAGRTPARGYVPPSSIFGAITPVVSLSSTSTLYLVSVGGNGSDINLFTANSVRDVAGPAVITLTAPLLRPPPAPQPASGGGRPVLVDSGDSRAQNAVWEGGRLWLTATEACPPSFASACARVLELSAPGANLLVDTDVSFVSDVYYPAVAPDPLGNAVVAFSFSSPGTYPSVGYTYVRPDGAAAGPRAIAFGSAPNESTRFGDYSGIARDPTDPFRFWLAAELGAATPGVKAGFGWSTAIAAVRIPPQPPAVLPSGPIAADRSATFAAEVYPEGSTTTYTFQYGPTTAYGSQTPAGTLPGTVRSQVVRTPVAGLQPGTTYHFRLVATNGSGVTQGPDETVAVPASLPALSYPPRAVTRRGRTATLRALVTPNGADTTVVFRFGRTVRYTRTLRPPGVAGSAGPTLVSVKVTRLLRKRTYHFRAIATNSQGSADAGDRRFRTS